MKNADTQWSMVSCLLGKLNENETSKEKKILGAVSDLLANQHSQSGPIPPK